MTCSYCGGVWHPATGAQHGRLRSCGPCERDFWAWVRGNRQHGPKPSFSDAAVKWKAEVREAEKIALARELDRIWGKMPHYKGTIFLVQKLTKLILQG